MNKDLFIKGGKKLMSLAQWKPEYVTGNSKVDEQHKYLFEIINRLHTAMLEGYTKDVIKNTLEDLLKYTVEHFTMEELLMLYHRYPLYVEHKQKHTILTDKLKDLCDRFDDKNRSINLKLLQFLNQWLAHHIKGEDQKLIKFLKEKQQENDHKTLVKA